MVSRTEGALCQKQAGFTSKGNCVHLLMAMPESFGYGTPSVIGGEN